VGQYKYKVRDREGKTKTGIVTVASEAMARTTLARQRLKIISIKEVVIDEHGDQIDGLVLFGGKMRIDGSGNVSFGNLSSFKPPVKDLIIMTKQIATMVSSGLALNKSFDMLSSQQKLPMFGKMLASIRKNIEDGNTLGASMRKFPNAFDTLYVSMIDAGEKSGKLPEIMMKLLVYIEKSAKIKSQVASAMRYPLIILFVATVVVIALLVFVVPVFAKQFEGSGRALPYLTQLVLDASNFLQSYAHYGLGALAVAGFALMKYIETPKGRAKFDDFLLKAPILGEVLKKIAVGRFCSTMSSMLAAGVPMLEALQICARSSGNVVIENLILECKMKVEKGSPLSDAISKYPMFPKIVVSMITVGEESGKLDDMLMKIALFYEEEVDEAIKGMLALIEPIMIVGIGGVIGVIVIAMYLPILDLGNTVGG
jgi:type IV pilus assembly protein PilC